MFGHKSEADKRLGDLRLSLINSELKQVFRWVTACKIPFLHINRYSLIDDRKQDHLFYPCSKPWSWRNFLTSYQIENERRSLKKKQKNKTTLVIQSRKKSCALVDLKASRSSFKMKHLHQHQVRRGLLLFACEAKSIFLNSPHDYVHCENQWISASDIRQLLYRYNILICRQVCRNLTSCCKFQRSKLVLKTSKLYFIV